MEIDNVLVYVLTSIGKEQLSEIERKQLTIDIELPINVAFERNTETITVASSVCEVSRHNLVPPVYEAPGQYLIDTCRLIISKMVMEQIHANREEPNDIDGHAYQGVMAATKTTGNGSLLFGIHEVEITNVSPVTILRWSSRITDEVRKLLVLQLERNKVDFQQVVDDLMCSEPVTKAILDGTVEMSLEKFLILCKINGQEPQDVINAAIKNNAGYIRGLDSEES